MSYYYSGQKHGRMPIQDIIAACDRLGFIFHSINYSRYSYVFYYCKKHFYKGIQKINRQGLMRWAQKGQCECSYSHRDEKDVQIQYCDKMNIIVVGKYINAITPIQCRCVTCGNVWFPTPNKLSQYRGCPLCAIQRTKTKLLKDKQLFACQVKQKYPMIQVLQYNGANNKVVFQCLVCGNIQMGTSGYRLLHGERGCSYCQGSTGEKLIRDWLVYNNIKYEREKQFDGCQLYKKLRFDFFVPEYNLCIEYQGQQHYYPVDFTGAMKEQDIVDRFIGQQKRDKIKKEWCKLNQIELLIIPFWNRDNIDSILTSAIRGRRDCNALNSNI